MRDLLRRSPFSQITKLTGSTNPLALFVSVKVIWRKGMTALAVGLASVCRSRTIAAHHIFNSGYGLQVFGIHAGSDAAKVVNSKPFRNRPYAELISPPVGRNIAIDGAGTPLAVAPVSLAGRPQPTGISKFHLRPESFGHTSPLDAPVTTQPTVMLAAQLLCEIGLAAIRNSTLLLHRETHPFSVTWGRTSQASRPLSIVPKGGAI